MAQTIYMITLIPCRTWASVHYSMTWYHTAHYTHPCTSVVCCRLAGWCLAHIFHPLYPDCFDLSRLHHNQILFSLPNAVDGPLANCSGERLPSPFSCLQYSTIEQKRCHKFHLKMLRTFASKFRKRYFEATENAINRK